MSTDYSPKIRTSAIIPARYASTRLPGKLLLKLGEKTILEHVYSNALACDRIDQVVIATDHELIRNLCIDKGLQFMMTSDHHQSGTDRCAEVALQMPDADNIINIQGDEPFFQAEELAQFVDLMQRVEVQIGTLGCPIDSIEYLTDPSKVKVAVGRRGEALYFSRAPIPYVRDIPREDWLKQKVHYRHIGVYGFKRSVLLAIANMEKGVLERTESLEQLRWLENGIPIHILIGAYDGVGIDTPEDYKRALAKFSAKG